MNNFKFVLIHLNKREFLIIRLKINLKEYFFNKRTFEQEKLLFINKKYSLN